MKKKTICSICGKEVNEQDLMPNGMPDGINGAVIGELIKVEGHPTCIHNVDNLIVIPNRGRVAGLMTDIQKDIEEGKERDEILSRLERETLPTG